MSFDEKLRILRKNNNLSQEELAAKLQVSRQAISKWETDTIPDIDNILKISTFFNCSTDYLLSDTEAKESIAVDSVKKEKSLSLEKTSLIFSLASFLILLTIKIFAHIFCNDDHSPYQSTRLLIDKYNLYIFVYSLLFIWFVTMSTYILFPLFNDKSKRENKVYLLLRCFLYCLFIIGTYIMIQELLFYGVLASSNSVVLLIVYLALLFATIVFFRTYKIKMNLISK